MKQAARANRIDERRAKRARQRQFVRCLWVWPFGHEYVNFSHDPMFPDFRCVECDKKRTR